MGVIYDPILDDLRTKDASGGGSDWGTETARAVVPVGGVAEVELLDCFIDAYDLYQFRADHLCIDGVGANVLHYQLGHSVTPVFVTTGYMYHQSRMTSANASYVADIGSATSSGNLISVLSTNTPGAGVEGLIRNTRDTTTRPLVTHRGLRPEVSTNRVYDGSGLSGLAYITTKIDHIKFFLDATDKFAEGTTLSVRGVRL